MAGRGGTPIRTAVASDDLLAPLDALVSTGLTDVGAETLEILIAQNPDRFAILAPSAPTPGESIHSNARYHAGRAGDGERQPHAGREDYLLPLPFHYCSRPRRTTMEASFLMRVHSMSSLL